MYLSTIEPIWKIRSQEIKDMGSDVFRNPHLSHHQGALGYHYFFPDFLIPCCPAFKGPFPFAFSAIALLAFASVASVSRGMKTPLANESHSYRKEIEYIPALTFS